MGQVLSEGILSSYLDSMPIHIDPHPSPLSPTPPTYNPLTPLADSNSTTPTPLAVQNPLTPLAVQIPREIQKNPLL